MRIALLAGTTALTLVAGACEPTQPPTPTPAPVPTATPVPPTATPAPPTPTSGPATLELTSTAFGPKEMIPKKYAREYGDVSPPLAWGDPPAGTKSLVIMVFSNPMPMGSGGRWVQWILYNIPPETRFLPEGVVPDAEGKMPDGSRHLPNSWGELKYGGLAPEGMSTFRYYFQIYALDTMLDIDVAVDKEKDAWIGAIRDKMLQVMEGHILAQGELEGKYKKGG
jgi:Raf kinase inhibitor-like YbhB/YbcL family protein